MVSFQELSHLQQRLLVGIVSALWILLITYLSFFTLFKPLFLICVAIAIATSLSEYYHIAEIKGYRPLARLAIGATCLYIATVFFSTQYVFARIMPELLLIFIFLLFFVYYFVKPDPTPMVNLAVTLFGFAYVTMTLSYILKINYFFPPEGNLDGRWWLCYLLAVTKMTDTGGFFVGKKIGKTPLAPRISPKKTLEGAVGGMVFAIGTSVLFYIITHMMLETSPMSLTLWQSLWLGGVIGIVAQFGDLAESLLKRDAGIKDSNHLPGLGGMLDIVDSLIFTTPLLYVFLQTQGPIC